MSENAECLVGYTQNASRRGTTQQHVFLDFSIINQPSTIYQQYIESIH